MSTTKTSTTIYSIILFITLSLTVTGQDVFVRFHQQPEKTSCHLPEELLATLEKGEKRYYDLRLIRNDDIDINIPVFIVSKHSNGEPKFTHRPLLTEKNIAVYQDLENGAAVLIQCINEVSETDGHFRLDGHLHLDGKHYRVEPYLTNGRIFQHPHHVDKHAYNISIQEESHACPLHEKQDEEMFLSRKTKVSPETPPLFKSLNRQKRTVETTSEPYIIDIAIHVDKTAYETWLSRSAGDDKQAELDIRRYFTHVMNVVNMRYQTLKPEVDITIRPFNIVIHKNETRFIDELKENRSGEIKVNAEAVLDKLTEWIQPNQELIGPYDHIMLYTGYNLYSNGNEEFTTGLATVGTMCNTDGTSISVVEDRGGFQSIYISAHELGHGLNSNHDGDQNSCMPAERHIMAPRSYNETTENALNPWSFSSCSKDYISRYIQDRWNETSFKSCLTKKLEVSNIPNISNQAAGQIYGPDEQCRHFLGSESYVCRERVFGNETNVCRKMFCNKPGSDTCREIIPAFGTSCGNKKWCEEGVCVHNDAAPSRETNCIFGDYSGTLETEAANITCAKIRSEENYYCYMKIVTERCCETCVKVKTNNSVCLYGDKVKGCKKENCGEIEISTNKSYDIRCCKTCNYNGDVTETTTESLPTTTSQPETTTSNCHDVSSVNSMTCAQFLEKNGAKQCYNNKTEEACCKSCSERRINIPNCPYGDRADSNCKSEYCATQPKEYNETCCKTCCKTCSGMQSKTTEKSMTTAAPQTTQKKTEAPQTTQKITEAPQTTKKTTTQSCSDSSIENMKCLEYIKKYGKSKCYLRDVKKACCSTCKLYERPSNTGCEFGNKDASCSQKDFSKIQSCDEQTAEQCCESCANLQPTPAADCIDNASGINEISCANYITKNGKSSCYDSQVKRNCCDTCDKIGDHTLKGCEYGDLNELICKKVDISKYDSCGEITKKFCCYQCLKILWRNQGGTANVSTVISSVTLHVFLCAFINYLLQRI